MPYKPYPILDFNTGLFTAKESWISPKDAFTSIQDGRTDKGVLKKRNGYGVFATHGVTNENLATGDGGTTDYISALYLSDMYGNVGSAVDYDDCSEDPAIGWTLSNTTLVENGSNYTIATSPSNGTATRAATVASGKYYRIKVDVSTIGGNTEFKILFNGSAVSSSYDMDAISGFVEWSQVFLSNFTGATTYGIEILNDPEALLLNNISIYEVEAIGDVKTEDLIGTSNIEITDTVETFTDDGAGTLTGDLGGSGAISYVTGQYSVTFNTAPPDGTNITANYRFNAPDRPVMGLPNYLVGNDPSLLRFDTEKAFSLDENNKVFKEIPFKDGNSVTEFSGDESDFFWSQNWVDRMYITNNADQIQLYEGEVLEDYDIDLSDAETGNDIDTALMIFIYKSRVMLLRTTETGTVHFQRARWSDVSVGGIVTWSDEFVDAPTEEIIVSAGFLNEDLIVFFESSVWKLIYTGDTVLPFRWERISEFQGSPSTFSLVTFSDKLATPGQYNMLGATSTAVFGLDQRIPREILKFQQDKAELSYGSRIDETNEAMFTFVSSGNTDGFPDSQLVLNFDNNSYHLYTLPIHSIGQTVVDTDAILDEIEEILDTIDISFDDESLQAGFPITIFGDKNGVVYQYNITTADNETAIDFNMKTIQLNPATAQGVSVRLGYVDFLVTSDPTNTLNISLFLNQETTAYLTESIDCVDDGDKTWKRVYSGAISNYHQIGIQNNTSTDDPEIHAIVPYFDLGGRQV